MKRICKDCGIEKDYEYLSLNTQGRKVYHDGANGIWHGKNCYECHLKYVKLKADKTPLTTKTCSTCLNSFQQLNSRMLWCSRACRLKTSL